MAEDEGSGKPEGLIKNWIHWDGAAYPVEPSNIIKVHIFMSLLFAEIPSVKETKPYGDKQYFQNNAIVVKEEKAQRALCAKLGCDFDKLVNKEPKKKSGKPQDSSPVDDVPF